jgi:hypothetical protein
MFGKRSREGQRSALILRSASARTCDPHPGSGWVRTGRVGVSSIGILDEKVVPPHHPVDGSVALAPALNTPNFNTSFLK